MARINISSDDDSLPDLADLLRATKLSPRKKTQQTSTSKEGVGKSAPDSQQVHTLKVPRPALRTVESAIGKDEKEKKPRQRVLRKVENNAVLASALKERITVRGEERGLEKDKSIKSRTPRRIERPKVRTLGLFDNDKDVENETQGTKEQEDRNYYYDSDGSLPSLSKLWSKSRFEGMSPAPRAPSLKLDSLKLPSLSSSTVLKDSPFIRQSQPSVTSRSRQTSPDDDRVALLVYEPPKRFLPYKRNPSFSRPSTPPLSPPNRKVLNSPSKAKPTKIPTAPIHPDIDAFWSQDAVNDWNEQWSPRKVLTSPRKNRFVTPTSDADSDLDVPSPSTSPRKSPVKKDKSALQAKKAFEARKHKLAEDFLKELDEIVTRGKIADLAASGGGVKIIWNKKLNSTAGRANWRRESTKVTHSDGSVDKKYRHIANIELAEKVIDDEDRLINVLAHEFCHLANFMVSGVKDNPHGKEFKEWAKKCSIAFRDRNVIVTTKHSYAIDYKYMWECTSCGHEYKRHSKSIDPIKQTCGACKSKLVQTKPVPRNVDGKGKVSEYQNFVKENFLRVKNENLGASHGSVMGILGRQYRERKMKPEDEKRGSEEKDVDVESIVREMEIITLDD